MKESAWDKQLWHDKMQQLPLEGDEHAMWQNMQGLLDDAMPVKPSGSGPASPKNLPGAGTIISAVIIVSAVTVLVLHLLGVFNTGKTYRANDKLMKDSLTTAINTEKRANAGQRDSTTTTQPANDPASTVNATNKTKPDSVGPTTVSPAAGSNSPANTSGTANPAITNAGNGTITSNGKSANKNPGLSKRTANGGINHTLIGNSHNSRNTYLQGSGNNSKAHGTKGKSSTNSPNDNQVTGASRTDNTTGGQTASNGNANVSAGQNQGKNDSLAAVLEAKQHALQQGGLIASTSPNTVNQSGGNKTGTGQPVSANGTLKDKTAKNSKPNKPAKKQVGNAKFEFDIRFGWNSGKGSSVYPGITAGYFITPKLGILIGADVMASRTLSGNYNSKTELTYRVDTGKFGTRQSGQIVIGGSRKTYSVDVPLVVNYRINQYISVYGGPVLSIQVKTNATSPALINLANSNDTTRSLVAPYVNSTVINNKFDYGITGGVRLHYSRWFINAGYVQDGQTYTISSGLGSAKINRYHTVQVGVGFQLFKPKEK